MLLADLLYERHTKMWSEQMGPPLRYRERERPGELVRCAHRQNPVAIAPGTVPLLGVPGIYGELKTEN
jgi:hypothetical protein